MRNLILLLARYGSLIVFVILEFICFYLIVNFNKSQGDIWIHSANLFSGNVNEQINKVNSYLELQSVNDSLLQENAKLLQSIINYRIFDKENSFQQFEERMDSLDYILIPAMVNDRTIHLRNNYLTINKGLLDGLEPGMGVISKDGIVGIVGACTDNFAQVLMVLHSQSRISAQIKSKEFSGTLSWQNSDPRILNLDYIPKYAELMIGDTIITSGFSTAFPQGIEVGFVQNYSVEKGSNNLQIDVKLKNDLGSVSSVYLVKYLKEIEKDTLKKTEIIE